MRHGNQRVLEHPDNQVTTQTPTQPRNVFGAKRVITDPDTSPEQSNEPSTSGTTETFTNAPKQPAMTDNQGSAEIDMDPQPQGWNVPAEDAEQPVTQINYTATTDEEKTSRSLKESLPKIFDREREYLENFMDEFDIYTKINRNNDGMKEAYSRVLMCLSFIKGKKVRDWAKGRVGVLDKEIKDGTRYDNERLWADFGNTFVEAFTDTTRAQDAYNKLKELKMEGDDLDLYISTHTTLVRLSKWAPEGEVAIETFKEGLKRQSCLAVMRHDYQPKPWKNGRMPPELNKTNGRPLNPAVS